MAALASLPSTHKPHYSSSPLCISASKCPCPPLSNPHPVALLQPSRLKKRVRSLSSNLKRPRKVGRVLSLWTHLPNSPFKKPEDSTPIELEPIKSEDEFASVLAEAQERSKPIIVDWMAAWCRKCIYLKPKLEKLASEFRTDSVKFYCVDVNTVPQTLVKRADVTKMPTIQLWKDGEKCDEVIGGHKAWLVVDEVREMVKKHLLMCWTVFLQLLGVTLLGSVVT